jgi:hypothetical protein
MGALEWDMTAYLKRLHLRAKTYIDNKEGATAVEFAIVAIPFFMFIFAIIELSIVFFINSALTHSVSEAGRQIRTGNFQACGSAEAFKELVCDGMNNMSNCPTSIRIDVISEPTFSGITLPEPPDPDPNAPVGTGDYENTAAGSPVVIRALFYYKLALPASFTRLETIPGSGLRVLESSTAFRNEPFPAPGTCQPTT